MAPVPAQPLVGVYPRSLRASALVGPVSGQLLAASQRSMTHRLFVYGTLAPGRPNEHVLAGVPGEWAPATVRGTLRQEGWGGEMGYPAIVLDEHGGEVEGYLFTSERLPEHWPRLDAFEGAGYEHVLATATCRDGTAVDANIYTLAGRPPHSPAGGS